jgi:Domain of unknown function (DUF4136)
MANRNACMIVPLVAAMALAACATGAKVDTMLVDDAHLPERATFAWQPTELVAQGGASTAADAAELDRLVRREVLSDLELKGYRQATPDTADFLVTYQVVVNQRGLTAPRPDPAAPSVSGSVGPGDPLDILREDARLGDGAVTATDGSLLVFATDRRTGRILWRGVARDTTTSVHQAIRVVPGAVHEMMKAFPARP